MYQPNEYLSNRAQLKKRIQLLAIPSAIFLSGIIYTLCVSIGSKTVHLEWITTLLTIVLGVLILFMDAMTLAPIRAYGRHLNGVMNGRVREMEGYFKSIEQDTCLREGVTYHAMIISQEDMNNEEDDRLFYFDALKQFPSILPGDRVRVTFHDRAIAKLEKI